MNRIVCFFLFVLALFSNLSIAQTMRPVNINASGTLAVTGAATLSSTLGVTGQTTLGNSALTTGLKVIRDANAGGSTNTVAVSVGNSGSAQGGLKFYYVNAAASGTPSGQISFEPRNNADSSDFSGGSITFTKTSGANTATMALSANKITTSSPLDVTSAIRAMGSNSATTGAGVEIDYGAAAGSTGRVFAFDRAAGLRKAMIIDGLTLALQTGATDVLTINSSQVPTFTTSLNVTGLVKPTGGHAPVSNSTSTGERVERMLLTNNTGSCTITSQSGAWASSATHGGTGICSVTMAGFSATPSCTCSVVNAGGRTCDVNPSSTTALSIRVNNGGGSAEEGRATHVICMGAK
jgi:fibronectin-binding autotransporter adhesin